MTDTEILILIVEGKGECTEGILYDISCDNCPLYRSDNRCTNNESSFRYAKKLLYDIDPSLLFDLIL